MDKFKLLSVMAGKGMSQRTLSERVKMSKNSFNQKINGKRSFSADEAMDICEALGIDDDAMKAQIFLARSSQNKDEPA